ncbi:MAG TPA: FAD-dependent oxidoreductase [Polyangiaceae bacterium]|jgi:nitrite reductase (NADH) large subunit|nr:FAD-dependent oxidoreductase [Polyangiaceae bacterium]
MARRRFVIIGDGAAGLAAAERLRALDPAASIGIFTDDPNPGYYRAALTNYLLGELREDQLWAVSPDFYETLGIRRVFGRVVGVDTSRSVVWDTASPTPTPYDALLVASGAKARMPTFEGAHLQGVMTLRSIQDARQVVDQVHLRKLSHAVVLGGGALGLEWAHALREHGVTVALVEVAPRLLPGALDEVASDLLAARLRQAGIQVILGDAVVRANPGPDGTLASVTLRSGQALPCGLLAAALGVVPSAEFLKGSGITLGEDGAVLTSRTLATNVANVFAAGDVARVEGEALRLWEPARSQALVAAENMAGGRGEYTPGVHYFATRLFDLDFARLGKTEREGAREFLVDFPRGTGTIAYRKLALENGRVVGALMLGERAARVRRAGRHYKRLIDTGVDVTPIRDKLLDATFDFEGFLHTQELFAKPVQKRPATSAVKAKQIRGTQLVALGDPKGTALLANLKGTSLLAGLGSGAGGTVAVPSARGTSTSQVVASQAPATLASPRGSTRVLSIGFHAEATAPPEALLPPLEARLDGLGRSFPIARPVFSLGRARESDVVVDHDAVAGLHAQITRHDASLYLRDGGSRTGTFLNGRLLVGAQALFDGDTLRVGPAELILRAPSLKRAEPAHAVTTTEELELEVRSGRSMGISFALRAAGMLIGSAPGSSIELHELSVAPQHARLRKTGDQVFVSDLGSGYGTWVGGAPLPPGVEAPLAPGAWLRVGGIDLMLVRGSVLPAAAFQAKARLKVDAGPGFGTSITVTSRAVVGSANTATLSLAGLAPAHLELALNEGTFFARDLSGGGSFRSGSPVGNQWIELRHGDTFLLGGATMLRFEEVP